MNSSLERSRKIRTAGVYVFFLIGSVIMIFPFVWMFLTSFKDGGGEHGDPADDPAGGTGSRKTTATQWRPCPSSPCIRIRL